VAAGWGRVVWPNALDREYPNAPGEWRSRWVFPQASRWVKRVAKVEGLHHVDASLVQKAVLGGVVACYREHLGFVREHVRSRTGQGRRLLVEGSAILPADVAPTLASPADALWLVPTRAFHAHHYAQRPWIGGVLRECVDPAAAFERWMERDVRFAAWLEDEVGGLGLGCIAVDGARSVVEVAGVAVGWFGLVGGG
jgi:hypothetical protein